MSLRRNSLWNLSGSAIPFLFGIITIPFLLERIGVESFGILTLIWTLIGYFSFFDFGLGRALTQQIASCLASKRNQEIGNVVKTGMFFVLTTGLIGSLILAALSNQLAYHWLNVTPTFQRTTFIALLITCVGIPMTTLTSGLKGILEAYENFRLVNILRIILGIANFGFPVVSILIFGPSLIMIIASLVAARSILFLIHLYFVGKKLKKEIANSKYGKETLVKLLSFGTWMTVSNIISPLMVVADRFIISSLLGAGVVAYYTVPADILVRMLIIPAALTTTLFPRLTSLLVSDKNEANALFSKSIKIIFITMAPMCLITAIGSYWGLFLWLGEEFAGNSWKIASIFSIGILLNSIAQVPYAKIQASGKTKITALIHIGEVIFYIPLLLVFLNVFSLTGAAVAWSIRAGMDLILLFAFSQKNKN